jgi:hypothetical protein
MYHLEKKKQRATERTYLFFLNWGKHQVGRLILEERKRQSSQGAMEERQESGGDGARSHAWTDVTATEEN